MLKVLNVAKAVVNKYKPCFCICRLVARKAAMQQGQRLLLVAVSRSQPLYSMYHETSLILFSFNSP